VKAAGAATIQARGDVSASGANFKAEGTNCDIKAKANATLEGGAIVTVKGSLVKIN
jgi:hypothetical protein